MLTVNKNMLFLLLWIAGVLLVFGLCLFIGRKKDAKPEADDRFAENIRNYCMVSLMMCILLFPLNTAARGNSALLKAVNGSFNPVADIRTLLSTIKVSHFANQNAHWFLRMSIYPEVIMSSVFLFFTGMRVYSDDIRIRRKIYLPVLLILPVVPFIRKILRLYELKKNIKVGQSIRYTILESVYAGSRYLLCMAIAAIILIAVYITLKKLIRSELLSILAVLVFSCFPPVIYAAGGIKDPNLMYMYLGTNMPLLPLGILAGKYRTRMIPKKRSWRNAYICIWSVLAVLSYGTLCLLQPFVLAMHGVDFKHSTSFCATFVVQDNMKVTRLLDPYSKAQCITWLVLGLSIVMLLLMAATVLSTGNRLTGFLYEHTPEILLLSYSIYFIRFTLNKNPLAPLFPSGSAIGSLAELAIILIGASLLRKLLSLLKRRVTVSNKQ